MINNTNPFQPRSDERETETENKGGVDADAEGAREGEKEQGMEKEREQQREATDERGIGSQRRARGGLGGGRTWSARRALSASSYCQFIHLSL